MTNRTSFVAYRSAVPAEQLPVPLLSLSLAPAPYVTPPRRSFTVSPAPPFHRSKRLRGSMKRHGGKGIGQSSNGDAPAAASEDLRSSSDASSSSHFSAPRHGTRGDGGSSDGNGGSSGGGRGLTPDRSDFEEPYMSCGNNAPYGVRTMSWTRLKRGLQPPCPACRYPCVLRNIDCIVGAVGMPTVIVELRAPSVPCLPSVCAFRCPRRGACALAQGGGSGGETRRRARVLHGARAAGERLAGRGHCGVFHALLLWVRAATAVPRLGHTPRSVQ